MPFSLHTIPCLSDNYAFILHNEATGSTALIDAPEAAPIAAFLSQRGWQLDQIALTHHHPDHIAGVEALGGSAQVIGAAADAHRLPPLDLALAPGARFALAGADTLAIDVPGHTVGHLAFHAPDAGVVFTGDSLMAMGCGRLFEGTPEMMWHSLQTLRALPDQTRVASGHEYTQTNARFALSLTPDHVPLTERCAQIDALRKAGKATVPSILEHEIATNPFLRADDPAMAQAMDMAQADPLEIFAKIRALRDNWQ